MDILERNKITMRGERGKQAYYCIAGPAWSACLWDMNEIQMALAGGAVEAERSARSGSLAEAPAAAVALVGESGS